MIIVVNTHAEPTNHSFLYYKDHYLDLRNTLCLSLGNKWNHLTTTLHIFFESCLIQLSKHFYLYHHQLQADRSVELFSIYNKKGYANILPSIRQKFHCSVYFKQYIEI